MAGCRHRPNQHRESTPKSYGILSFGGYVPTLRINRQAIAQAIAWAVPSAKGLAKGERAFANWDEDSLTLAVEAARDCLPGTVTTEDLSGSRRAATSALLRLGAVSTGPATLLLAAD
jgi:3-hydroxy-3-methylglutaryl CoA synthase